MKRSLSVMFDSIKENMTHILSCFGMAFLGYIAWFVTIYLTEWSGLGILLCLVIAWVIRGGNLIFPVNLIITPFASCIWLTFDFPFALKQYWKGNGLNKYSKE